MDIGDKFGRWTIIDLSTKLNKYGFNDKVALCVCECGTERTLKCALLKIGHTKSCGCLQKDIVSTHGYYKHPLYNIWVMMLKRCYKSWCKNYKNYGARGIMVCDEWRNNVVSFIEWSEKNGYKKGLTIERINVNGNYEPSNCTYATKTQQNKNTRKAFKLEYEGKIYTLRDLSEKVGINHMTISYRLKKGLTLIEAIKK